MSEFLGAIIAFVCMTALVIISVNHHTQKMQSLPYSCDVGVTRGSNLFAINFGFVSNEKVSIATKPGTHSRNQALFFQVHSRKSGRVIARVSGMVDHFINWKDNFCIDLSNQMTNKCGEYGDAACFDNKGHLTGAFSTASANVFGRIQPFLQLGGTRALILVQMGDTIITANAGEARALACTSPDHDCELLNIVHGDPGDDLPWLRASPDDIFNAKNGFVRMPTMRRGYSSSKALLSSEYVPRQPSIALKVVPANSLIIIGNSAVGTKISGKLSSFYAKDHSVVAREIIEAIRRQTQPELDWQQEMWESQRLQLPPGAPLPPLPIVDDRAVIVFRT